MWQLRTGAWEDHDAVVQLWQTVGLGGVTSAEWQALTAGPHGLGPPERVAVVVAEENGLVVGTVVTAFDGWRAFIYHAAVAPGSQHRGIAKGLMAEAEQRVRALGARRIFALVNENNPAGLALCAAAGYEPEGDIAFVKEIGA